MAGAHEILNRVIGGETEPEHDPEASMFDGEETNPADYSDDSSLIAGNQSTIDDGDAELTTDQWTAETVRLLEQVKEQIADRFAKMEKRNDEQHQISVADHASAETAISSLMQAEAKFYSHINIELPGIIKKNIEAASQGILDAQLEIIAGDIKDIIHQHITDELTPQLTAIKNITTEMRLAGNEVEAKTRGWRHFLVTAGIATVVSVAIFFSLKAKLGLGIDAEYGRKARTVIENLDSGNRATLQQLINSK